QILLGFEPLEGIYTRENLTLALYTIINRHRIKDQILAITTNNTLNNKIIFDKLSLNKLLYRIKAKPKNDIVDIRGQKGDIINNLDRVFKLYNKLFKYLEALISQLKKKKAYRSSVSTTQRPISLRLVIYMRIALSSHQRISYSTSNARNSLLKLARALEIPKEGKNKKILPSLEGINLISDTKKGNDKVRLSVRAGKRQKSILSNHKSEQSDNNNSGLPSIS
ncbi:uncharacterized protein N7477_002004, partial [Penicillium maclennaniae]|uniref:uncharacterized protein n=1 Tax=Penicillium maclennaniae TaxID=1343394 RepID=UPI002542093D